MIKRLLRWSGSARILLASAAGQKRLSMVAQSSRSALSDSWSASNVPAQRLNCRVLEPNVVERAEQTRIRNGPLAWTAEA